MSVSELVSNPAAYFAEPFSYVNIFIYLLALAIVAFMLFDAYRVSTKKSRD
jgi:hypothetical protein